MVRNHFGARLLVDNRNVKWTCFVLFLFAVSPCDVQKKEDPIRSFLRATWDVTELANKNRMGKLQDSSCIYLMSFDNVKFVKKSRFIGAISIHRRNCPDGKSIYSYFTRFEIETHTSMLYVKKIDHYSFNSTVKQDPAFQSIVDYFQAHKIKLHIANNNASIIYVDGTELVLKQNQ